VHSVSHNAGSLLTQFITFLDVKSSYSMAIFSLNHVMISTSNKIRNEYPASTGSLAGSKRVFFLHSICLARTRTNEPPANLLHEPRHVEIDAAGSRTGFRQKSRKRKVFDQVCSWLE